MQKVDVLLVTATEVEAGAVLSLFPDPQLCHVGEQTYHDLGTIQEARIFMVQSEMGAGGPSGATLTIEESLRALNPSAVIMVGIAFGVSESRQHIGDILVAKQLIQYELQRVSTNSKHEHEIYLRDDRPSASHLMLQRFRAAANYWPKPPEVTFGSILSGAKLIDNQDFRDQLLGLAQEAIGGEMEGSGLYAVAQRKKVNWIVVKAICDWADGNKHHQDRQKRQRLAAENAARFTRYVLEQGGFAAPGQEISKTSSDDTITVEQSAPPSLRSKRAIPKIVLSTLIAIFILSGGFISIFTWYHTLAPNTARSVLDAYCTAQLAGHWDSGQWHSEANKYIAATKFDSGVEYSPSLPAKMSTYKDCHIEGVDDPDHVICETDREIYVVDITYNEGPAYRRAMFIQKVHAGWLLALEITLSYEESPRASNNTFPTKADCSAYNRLPDNTPAAA